MSAALIATRPAEPKASQWAGLRYFKRVRVRVRAREGNEQMAQLHLSSSALCPDLDDLQKLLRRSARTPVFAQATCSTSLRSFE